MPKFKELEYIAGEAAFEAAGKTESELFENAALALCEQMADTRKIKAVKKIRVELHAPKLDLLLHNFLSEIVFLKDSKSLIFKNVSVKVSKNPSGFELRATLAGQDAERVNAKAVRIDVKAVTFHDLRVEKKGNTWHAQVVLDI